jgi:hypothetical protein
MKIMAIQPVRPAMKLVAMHNPYSRTERLILSQKGNNRMYVRIERIISGCGFFDV